MASPYDLVALGAVQNWLGQTSDGPNLSALITQVSRAILTSLDRPSILPTFASEIRDGDGRHSLILRNWPVISVSSLLIDGRQVVASAPQTPGAPTRAGYVLEQVDPAPPGRMQALFLRDQRFRRGVQNVAVNYIAGYQVANETGTIPGAAPVLIAQAPYGAWASDGGVAYADGTPMVCAAGAPSIGQYSVSAGLYTFSAADAGADVLLTYGFVPADLAQAAMEWTAERYAYKSRIGQRSKTLGGQETVGYDLSAIPAFVAATLQPYRRIASPC